MFDLESAQKTIAEVAKLTNELSTVDERRKVLRGELKARRATLKQLLAGPRKARQPKDSKGK